MATSRYLQVVLTVIAVELGWIALMHMPAATVQAQAGATRVVVVGVATETPLPVEVAGPVKVESDKPLRVEPVPYTPSTRPGQ